MFKLSLPLQEREGSASASGAYSGGVGEGQREVASEGTDNDAYMEAAVFDHP